MTIGHKDLPQPTEATPHDAAVAQERGSLQRTNVPATFVHASLCGKLAEVLRFYKQPSGMMTVQCLLTIRGLGTVGQPEKSGRVCLYGIEDAYYIIRHSRVGDLIMAPYTNWVYVSDPDIDIKWSSGFFTRQVHNVTANTTGRWERESENTESFKEEVVENKEAKQQEKESWW